MKRYKQLNENGEVVMLLTYDFEPTISDPLIAEITAEEYETISAEGKEKAKAEAEAERAERLAKVKDTALKAKAYDIITGVAE